MSDFGTIRKSSPFILDRSKPDEERKETKVVITMVDGTTHKRNHPILTFEQGSEHVMFCLDEFENLSSQFQFDHHDNFRIFRDILGHTKRPLWDGLLPPAAHRNDAQFLSVKRNFLLKHFTRKSYQRFLEYIRLVKKPREFSSRQLQTRLSTLFHYT